MGSPWLGDGVECGPGEGFSGAWEFMKGWRMKSILVPLDGSPASFAALEQAVVWAGRMKAELRGIFIEDEQRLMYHPTAASFEGGIPHEVPMPEGSRHEEEEKLKAEGQEIQTVFDKTTKGKVDKAHLTIVRGDVNLLLGMAARSVDLVIIGKRGRDEPPDSEKTGPTTEAILHEALRPILVVPENPRVDGPVLFSYDGSVGVQRVCVPGTALAVLKGDGAVILTVDSDAAKARANQETLRNYMEPYGISPKVEQAKGKPTKAIVDTSEKVGAGMIVMGAFGHGQFRQLLFGSTTLDVLEHAHCPVLLMI